MDQFIELMREAAILVGIEAARLWPQMVLFHWLKAVGFWILMLTSLSISIRYIFSAQKAFKLTPDEGDSYFPQMVFAAVFGVPAMIVLVADGARQFAILFAPEASLAIRMIGRGG